MPEPTRSQSRADRKTGWTPHPLLPVVACMAFMLAIPVLIAAFGPRSLVIVPDPVDARVSIRGGRSVIGQLVMPMQGRAPVSVTVSRTGYVSRTLEVRPTALTGASDHTVKLEPKRVRLVVRAGPGDPIVSVFAGQQRVLVGRRRVSGYLPSGRYRVVATAPQGARAQRDVVLDRETRVELTTDPARQSATGEGIVEATGRVASLSFSPDGTVLAATLFDGPPDRELFAVSTLRRVPDAATEQMRLTGFTRGQVATSVAEGEVRYGIDATASAVVSQARGARAQTLVKTPTRPTLLGVADGGRRLVVACVGGVGTNGVPHPALIVVDTRTRAVADRIDSPTVYALAIAPDGRTLAVSDTAQGRIRLFRLAE